jgi:hypothetical protein
MTSVHTQIDNWLQGLERERISVSEFLRFYLSSNDEGHITSFRDLESNLTKLLDLLHKHFSFHTPLMQWAFRISTETYVSELLHLSNKESGFHFPVKNITEQRLRDLDMDDAAATLKRSAPHLTVCVKIFPSRICRLPAN